MPEPMILFSAHEAYLPAAIQELHEAFPDAKLERIGVDIGRLYAEGIDIADVARACRERPIFFVRHLMRQAADLPLDTIDTDPGLLDSTIIETLRRHDAGHEVALQVWRAEDAHAGPRTDDLWRELAESLASRGFSVARGKREWILSILLTNDLLYIGLNRREDALVDWPGGRLSLAKRSEQVSRSEFKLEELFKVSDVSFPDKGDALDLGASPGGWTRILRRRGLDVWAVDPADLDSRIAADRHVHHVRTTAGAFLQGTSQRFDLVVNDMRMTPNRSCGVMLNATRCLNSGALIILTLKISPRQPLQAVRSALELLRRSFEVRFARQLFHNRNEVTVVASFHGGTSRPGAGPTKRRGPSR